MKKVLLVAVLAVAFGFTFKARAQVDVGGWTFGSYGVTGGRFYISQLGRTYSNENQQQLIFHTFNVYGVKMANQAQPVDLSRVLTAPVYTTGLSDGGAVYDRIYAEFLVGTQNHIMELMIKLYQSPRLELVASFRTQAGVYAGHATEVYVRTDYDLMNANQNMIEYPVTSGSNQLYTASAKEISVSRTPPLTGGGVEAPIFSRAFSGNARDQQLAVVMLPGGGALNPVTMLMKNYSSTFVLPPTYSPGATLQGVATSASPMAATYAHTGRDQMMDVILKRVSSSNPSYSLSWNVSRRPGGRRLRVNWVMTATTDDPTYNPFATDDFENVKTSGNASAACNGRSFNDAMRQLVGPADTSLPVNLEMGASVTLDPYNQDHVYAPLGTGCPNQDARIHSWSSQELHAFMLSMRSESSWVAEDYSTYNVDMLQVNGVWAGDSNATGILFDFGASGFNSPPYREGVAMMMGNMQCGYPPQDKVTFLEAAAHEIAHAMGMWHSWTETSPTVACQTIECGSNAPCADANNPKPMMFSPNTTAYWYQNGPESLVKPGKYSVDWVSTIKPTSFRLPDGTCHDFGGGACPN